MLQDTRCSLVQATEESKEVIRILSDCRQDALCMDPLFEKACKLAEEFKVDVRTPRIA